MPTLAQYLSDAIKNLGEHSELTPDDFTPAIMAELLKAYFDGLAATDPI